MKAPDESATIPQALRQSADLWPDRGVHFYDKVGVKSFSSYPQLLAGATRVARALRGVYGMQPGDRLIILLPSGFDFIHAFTGALMAQVQPIPLPLPRESDNLTHALAHISQLADSLGARALLTPPESISPVLAMAEAQRHFDLVIGSDLLTRKPDDDGLDDETLLNGLGGDDVAYIQCSSGTTGLPKGVLLSHRNILTNLTDVGTHLQVSEEDVGVSWLPMIHDMGLLGVLLFAMCWGVPLVLLDPERFLKTPHEWLWCISNHGGTLSPASDFGYHYCARRARESDLDGLDLSTWRVAMSGSETVDNEHLQAFARRFAPHGLRPEVFVPVYGLAEATLAVTFGGLNQSVPTDHISRHQLETEGKAVPTDAPPGPATMTLIGVGKALPHVEVVLRNQEGEPVEDRTVGEVFVRGDSVMKGYVGQDESVEVEWVGTGDLGYTEKGELFILGRRSDVINLGDRVIYPHVIELLLSRIDGVRPGTAATFGIHRSTAVRSRHASVRAVARAVTGSASNATAEHEATALHGAECLIVAVEATEGIDHEGLSEVILHTLTIHLGVRPHDLRILSPGSIPKTSSGKLQRHLCRTYYLDEVLDRRDRQERRQALTTITERARSYVAQLGRRFRTYFDET